MHNLAANSGGGTTGAAPFWTSFCPRILRTTHLEIIMSQPVLLKVYAAFFPVSSDLVEKVREAASQALAMEGDPGPHVFFEDTMLRISFEGIYFPWEDVVPLLQEAVAAGAKGKMDVLDMEAWTMTRFEACDCDRTHATPYLREGTVSLNHVLDYSGL